jgi:hypothetical protein
LLDQSGKWKPHAVIVACAIIGMDVAQTDVTGYISSYIQGGFAMSNAAQKRAIRNYRSRQAERGIARFEVQALDADRELIRALARRLAEDSPEATQARTLVQQIVSGEPPHQGGILQALRRSPLVGADLDLDRAREEGRRVNL